MGSDEVIYESEENVQKVVDVKPNLVKVEQMHRVLPVKAASAMRY